MRPLRLFVAGLVPAGIAVVAFLNARAVSALVSGTVSQAALGAAGLATPSEAPREPEFDARLAKSARAILARNPFDHETGPLAPPADHGDDATPFRELDPVSAPLCEGVKPLVLVGQEDQSAAFAALDYGGKRLLRRRGGAVGDARVAYVGRDRLWLEGRMGLCQALLFADPLTPPPPPPAGQAVAGPRSALEIELEKRIVKTGPNEFSIERSALDRLMEAQQELMKARIVPEKVDDRVVGVRIYGVKPGSVVAILGIENGDRLETINGYEVSDPVKLLEAYARLRTGADRLSLHIVRAGRPLNIDYAIK